MVQFGKLCDFERYKNYGKLCQDCQEIHVFFQVRTMMPKPEIITFSIGRVRCVSDSSSRFSNDNSLESALSNSLTESVSSNASLGERSLEDGEVRIASSGGPCRRLTPLGLVFPLPTGDVKDLCRGREIYVTQSREMSHMLKIFNYEIF